MPKGYTDAMSCVILFFWVGVMNFPSIVKYSREKLGMSQYYGLQLNPAQRAGNMGTEERREMLFWTKEEYERFADAMMDKPLPVKRGNGPMLLDTITYRLSGHSTSDQNAYREKDEIEAWRELTPLLPTAPSW